MGKINISKTNTDETAAIIAINQIYRTMEAVYGKHPEFERVKGDYETLMTDYGIFMRHVRGLISGNDDKDRQPGDTTT